MELKLKPEQMELVILYNSLMSKDFLLNPEVGGSVYTYTYSEMSLDEKIKCARIEAAKGDMLPDSIKEKYTHLRYYPFFCENGFRPPKGHHLYKSYQEDVAYKYTNLTKEEFLEREKKIDRLTYLLPRIQQVWIENKLIPLQRWVRQIIYSRMSFVKRKRDSKQWED